MLLVSKISGTRTWFGVSSHSQKNDWARVRDCAANLRNQWMLWGFRRLRGHPNVACWFHIVLLITLIKTCVLHSGSWLPFGFSKPYDNPSRRNLFGKNTWETNVKKVIKASEKLFGRMTKENESVRIGTWPGPGIQQKKSCDSMWDRNPSTKQIHLAIVSGTAVPFF